MLQGDQDLREQYAPLVKHIEELHNLYKTLDQAREERGGISFESEEAKFIFNAERRIERIEQTQRNDAHKLIEECMITANISAARFVEKAKEPALFRIHDKPTTEAVTSFRSVLAELGTELLAAISLSHAIMPSCWNPSAIVLTRKCCKPCCCVP